MDCKQRSSIVSRKTPTVSKKTSPKLHPQTPHLQELFFFFFSKSSRRPLPASLWHESGTQQKLFRRTCSDEPFHFYTPDRNHYANNSLRIICNGRELITMILCNDAEMISPRFFRCNGQPHQLHTRFRFFNCSFLTRNGLHWKYVMSRKFIPPELSAVKHKGAGRTRGRRIWPQILLRKRAKMVLCP